MFFLLFLLNSSENAFSLLMFSAERRKYYKYILKTKTHPEKCISMIIYGIDQETMLLPKSYLNPKGLTNMWKIPTHVDMNEILHDLNLTVNMILQVLQKICRRSATCVILTI